MQRLLIYGLFGSVIGFHGVLLNYLIQVGMISANGLLGMFDWAMVRLLLDTPQGESTLWRLLGFTLALITQVLALQHLSRLKKPPGRQAFRIIILPQVLALIILAGSFQMSGHVSVLGTSGQLAIALHVIAFAFWVGSLLPLLWLCRYASGEELRWIMLRFGDHARLVLAVLVAAGLLMLWQLLESVDELVSSAYGLSLLLKFALVLGLMGIAALNRFTLVPKLAADSEAAALRLAGSIRMELVLAALILIVTAYLSTLVGPASHY